MWSRRPFLNRRSSALLSQHHTIRRRPSFWAPPHGDTSRIRATATVGTTPMPRPKPRQPAQGSTATGSRTTVGRHRILVAARAARPTGRQPYIGQKHLYLLLDDAKNGSGIHKVDIAADDPNGDATDSVDFGTLQRLPEPLVMRIAYSMVVDFAVLGSNVIGMGSGIRQSRYDSRSDGDTLTFDTKTADLALMPDLPDGVRWYPIEVAVGAGNRLYVIESGSSIEDYRGDWDKLCVGGMHCLKLDEDTDGGGKDEKPSRSNKEHWDWYTLYDYPSTRWLWSSDHDLLPLSPDGIRAHALHPGERAFFVSVRSYYYRDHRGQGTFSYNTERGRWTRHGDWELPFGGQAHYDKALGAWVGLHFRHGNGGFQPDGYLCSCDVPHLGRRTAPDWKLGKEKLFLEDPERLVDAKLVYMGGSRFCIVEILTREGVSREECIGDGDKCVLRLTTFRVKYDDDGELTTTARRPARLYKMSKYRQYFDWQAFWA